MVKCCICKEEIPKDKAIECGNWAGEMQYACNQFHRAVYAVTSIGVLELNKRTERQQEKANADRAAKPGPE